MPQWPVPSTYSIVHGGLPLYMELPAGAEPSAAQWILPGDVVEFTTHVTDCTVKAAAADTEYAIGIADISPQSATTPPRGGDRLTAYNGVIDATHPTADQVKIIRGPCTVMLRLAMGQVGVGCGEFVKPAASGEVALYACGTDHDCKRIAQALETVANDTDNFQWILCALERFG